MTVLISGATGFVGRALCERLGAAGHEVRAFSRSPRRAARSLPAVELFAWDAENEEPPPESLDGVDAIVHLAGEPVFGRWTRAKRQAIVSSRVDSTQRLVSAIARREQKPAVLICASAIGYYGDRGEQELTESAAPGDDFLAETSVAWERTAREAEQHGVRVVSLRIGVVLAPDGGALEQMLPPAKLGLGGPLGSGKQWWSWISRDDLLALIEFLLDNDASGPVNAVAPHPVRQREFARALGRVLHRPGFLPAPAFALKLILGGFSTELLSSKRVLPAAAERLGFRFQDPDLEPCLRRLLR